MTPGGSRFWSGWNRKIHLYVGLYLVVFTWLFTLSGLLLNHSWRFTEFWPQRLQTRSDHTVFRPSEGDDVARARNVMRQLNISGEIEWKTGPWADDRFEFRAVRPGVTAEVRADFSRNTAAVEEIRVNGWGVLRMLHTFTGVHASEAGANRDWWLTNVWSLSIDAVCIGLIALVLGGVVMALERRERWLPAGIALALGLLLGGFFVFGVRLL